MKIKKIVIIVPIIFLLLNTICFAEVMTNNFQPPTFDPVEYEPAFKLTGKIVEIIRTLGTVIAVVGVMVLGIKYMIGSVEQRAEYKKTMIPYLIGCIFIFAIGTVVSIIYSLVSQV